jgi:hypothetical protein
MFYKEYKGGFKNKKFILNYPKYNSEIRRREIIKFKIISQFIKNQKKNRNEKIKKYINDNINYFN